MSDHRELKFDGWGVHIVPGLHVTSENGLDISIHPKFFNTPRSTEEIGRLVLLAAEILEELEKFPRFDPIFTDDDIIKYQLYDRDQKPAWRAVLESKYTTSDQKERAARLLPILEKVDQRHRHTTPRSPNAELRRQVIERDNSTCQYCRRSLDEKEIVIDHVWPYSVGGETEIDNLKVACQKCNATKATRLPLEARDVQP